MTSKSSYIYTEYSTFLSQHLAGKIQKVSVDAGCTCPNRDGTVGWGGCTFCNNETFRPDYCAEENSVTKQLEKGKAFFARKYPSMRYLAYFQSYTNTYGNEQDLQKMYLEALSVPNVVGLVIGTRPDCVSFSLLQFLGKLAKEVFICIEYGVESTSNEILSSVNRGHTYECSERAIKQTADLGIYVCAHLILGLPGETKEMQLKQPMLLNQLPLDLLKLHQLQIVRGTVMAKQYAEHPETFALFSPHEYIKRVSEYLELLRPEIAVERFTSQSPPSLLIAPDWGLKNYEFVNLLKKYMQENDFYQGRKYKVDTLMA